MKRQMQLEQTRKEKRKKKLREIKDSSKYIEQYQQYKKILFRKILQLYQKIQLNVQFVIMELIGQKDKELERKYKEKDFSVKNRALRFEKFSKNKL